MIRGEQDVKRIATEFHDILVEEGAFDRSIEELEQDISYLVNDLRTNPALTSASTGRLVALASEDYVEVILVAERGVLPLEAK